MRKNLVKNLLDFLIKEDQSRGKASRILFVWGPTSVDKVETISKAVWYAKEHSMEAVKDGAYRIDLKNAKTLEDILNAIIETLNLTGIEPD